MGFTDEGRFSEGEAVLPPCAGRIRGLSCKTPAPQGVGVFVFGRPPSRTRGGYPGSVCRTG